MTIPRVPETYANQDWPRKVARSLNQLITILEANQGAGVLDLNVGDGTIDLGGP